uniref:Non-structural protein 2 n=4 Tax=Rotavirus B (isolate RVB/Human/China/ADRV/1982) TaxID=10942 RepID=I7FSD9_ROTGA|nr:nonstructural protein NSP2 [Human rotavirus B]AFP25392.1 nonstructural protein NSP2 [Human rotavirus B]
MTQSVSLSDFIVKTEDGYMPSDRECVALDRYLSKEQKELRETFKDGKNDRSALRIKMFLSPSPSRRFTQHGVVPMREIKTNTDIPSTLWTLVTDWLLNLLQDEENQEMFEDFISSKFPDVLASADKLARFAQRLEDRKDVLHKNFSKAMNAFGACFWAIKPTFATEGKCNVVRATDDSMILEFQPIPEYFRCGRSKATFYKLYPLTDEQPVNGMLALKAVAGNQFFMYHGHGHIRTVPYHELADAIKSFARKDKETLESISKSPLAAQCGSKFLDMLDGIRSKQKIEDVILKAKIFEKKRS